MINGKRARERGGESGTGLLPYYLFCAFVGLALEGRMLESGVGLVWFGLVICV